MGSLPCHIRIRRLDLLRFACWQPLSVLSRSDRKPQHKNLMIQSFNLVPRWPLVHCIGPASKSKLRDHPHSEFGTWGISWSERWKSWKILPKQLYNQSCCPWPKLGHWNPWFRFVPIYCSARALLWIPTTTSGRAPATEATAILMRSAMVSAVKFDRDHFWKPENIRKKHSRPKSEVYNSLVSLRPLMRGLPRRWPAGDLRSAICDGLSMLSTEPLFCRKSQGRKWAQFAAMVRLLRWGVSQAVAEFWHQQPHASCPTSEPVKVPASHPSMASFPPAIEVLIHGPCWLDSVQ